MLHYLFNNIFVENPNNKSQNVSVKDTLAFPINEENDLVLFSIIDMFEKAQQMFLIGGKSGNDYADLANYIEINLIKPDVMLTRNKLIIIKYRHLLVGIQLEIYDDKNYWSNIFNNTNFFSNAEHLFNLAHCGIYNTQINTEY